MPYTFPKHKKNANGTYGPTLHGHYYQAVYYHSQKAKTNAHKTKWKLIAPKQYEVFSVADGDKVEFYKEAERGLYGFLDKMSVILGTGEERIAFFPRPKNKPEAWHGYPITSADISNDDIIQGWLDQNMITTPMYRKLLKRQI